MTNNQLILPEVETSDEAHELVQQVLDDPRELAPAVQVRFAKRVGRPGASRVMLMDAQTSGPAGDQDEESESKLALRLADGTNVQLSLSFFNENQPALATAGAGGGGGSRRSTYSPFNAYVYEPRTYNVNDRDSSKLPLIMVSMAFLLGAACYGVVQLNGRVSEHDRVLSKTTKSAPVATLTAKAPPAKAPVKVASATTPALPKIHEIIPPAPPLEIEYFAPRASTKKSVSRTHSSHSAVHATSSHASKNEGFGFVPPPPPMAFASAPVAKGFIPPPPPTPYTIPTGMPTAFADPLGGLAPAVAHSNHSNSSTRKLEPVSMTTITPEPKRQPAQRNLDAIQPLQQISPSTSDSPIIQQYKDGAAVGQ